MSEDGFKDITKMLSRKKKNQDKEDMISMWLECLVIIVKKPSKVNENFFLCRQRSAPVI